MRPWAIRRSKLNHDLIGNRLYQALGAIERTMQGHVGRSPEMASDLPGQLQVLWQQIRSEARSLYSGYATEMSPACLFDEPPLCYCPPDTRRWLAGFVHSRWLKLASVEKRLSDLDRAVLCVDEAMRHLQEHLGSGDGAIDSIKAARSAATQLSVVLTSFPHGVLP